MQIESVNDEKIWQIKELNNISEQLKWELVTQYYAIL